MRNEGKQLFILCSPKYPVYAHGRNDSFLACQADLQNLLQPLKNFGRRFGKGMGGPVLL